METVQKCIGENARVAQSQAECRERYDELVSRYDTMKEKHDATVESIHAKRVKAKTLGFFAKTLRGRESTLTEFDEGLWETLVDFMAVYGKGNIGVIFQDGTEIRIG